MKHPPSAIGLVLCEQIVVEEGTRNVTPVNCFSFREMEAFPASTTFFALTWLADGRGEMVAEITVDRLDVFEEIYRDERKLSFAGPLHDARFIARIRDCEFATDGYYQVSLIIERELIAHRKFRVLKKGGEK